MDGLHGGWGTGSSKVWQPSLRTRGQRKGTPRCQQHRRVSLILTLPHSARNLTTSREMLSDCVYFPSPLASEDVIFMRHVGVFCGMGGNSWSLSSATIAEMISQSVNMQDPKMDAQEGWGRGQKERRHAARKCAATRQSRETAPAAASHRP